MPGIRELRGRIKSVRNIQQITRAMKMVASARLRRAQRQLVDSRPYAFKLRSAICEISGRSPDLSHPLLRPFADGRPALVVLTSDKGLCAGFNAQPLQAAARHLQSAAPGAVEVVAVGRKGLEFFRRAGVKAFKEWAGFWQDLNWIHANAIGNELIASYLTGRWSRLTLVYNRFKSMLAQELAEEELLPIPQSPLVCKGINQYSQFEFEPKAEQLYEILLPRYVKISIWHALLESKAAELAARMQAMGNATESAGDMIGELTLVMNRIRQSSITREISELVGSAEAVNA